MTKDFSAATPEIEKYVESVFQPEDAVLKRDSRPRRKDGAS